MKILLNFLGKFFPLLKLVPIKNSSYISKKNIIKKSITSFLILSFLFLIISPLSSAKNDQVFADIFEGEVPFTRTFIISAYYSPLPCQDRYATGTYDGDIRLNGRGVAGASGTPVYPGMIAAPREYPFGTKMDIPGVGIVSVQDRGGAIKSASENGPAFDRLDIWMGYGDKGLTRALNWGKRTIDVVVYGENDNIQEQIYLSDYNPDEKHEISCPPESSDIESDTVIPENTSTAHAGTLTKDKNEESLYINPVFNYTLQLESSGPLVKGLQEELKRLNYFMIEPTGYYGEITEHAVFKFQQSQNIVKAKTDSGAGVLGPTTRNRLNKIILSRESLVQNISKNTANFQNK